MSMCDQLNSATPAQWCRLLNGSRLPQDPGSLVDLLRGLEDLKSCASAVQARAATELDALRRDKEASLGVPAQQRGRGVASEVALARKESTYRGQRFLGLAKALVSEMPETLELLSSGKLNEWRATLAVRETACLSVQDRAAIDTELSQQLNDDGVMGDRKLVGWIRRRAYARDAASVARRAARAESERRVTLRPAPDTMSMST